MFEYQGLHHTWVEGFFWSFLLLQDIFPSKVTPSFKSSKTNILKSQFILKIPRLFIVINLNLLHVTNQNEDQVVTNGRWLIMTVQTWGFFWVEEHAVSCVLPLGHWIFFKLFWISIIVYIKQTGWSDQSDQSSNHLQRENFVIPKVIVIICEGWSFMRDSDYVRALTGRIWCFGSVVAYERWSLTWDGLTWRLNCMCCSSFCN